MAVRHGNARTESVGTANKTTGRRTEEPRRTARGLLAVSAFSDRVAKPLLGKRGLAEGDLVAHWEAIVGPTLAVYTLPEQLRFPRGKREDGELTVRVASGPFATQLQHDAPTVIARINGYFGYAAVKRLKLLQAPLPRPKPRSAPEPRPLSPQEEQDLEGMLKGVHDPDLRAALARLGRNMMRRRS